MLPRSTKDGCALHVHEQKWSWWRVSWGFLWVVLQQKVRGRHWESQESQYFKVGRLVVELWASLGCGYGLFSERGRKVNDPFPRWRCDTTGWRSVFFQGSNRSYRSIDHGKRQWFFFQPSRNFISGCFQKKNTRHFCAILGIYSLKFHGGFSNHEWIHPIAWLIAPSRMMYHDWCAALRLGVKFWVIF